MRILISCLAVSLILAASPAEAGWISKMFKLFSKQTDEVAETVTRREAREVALTAGAMGAGAGTLLGAGGILTAAGLIANPTPAEAADVEQEIEEAIEAGKTVYEARVCLHPERQEFYPVPDWATSCGDGTEPIEGRGVALTRADVPPPEPEPEPTRVWVLGEESRQGW